MPLLQGKAHDSLEAGLELKIRIRNDQFHIEVGGPGDIHVVGGPGDFGNSSLEGLVAQRRYFHSCLIANAQGRHFCLIDRDLNGHGIHLADCYGRKALIEHGTWVHGLGDGQDIPVNRGLQKEVWRQGHTLLDLRVKVSTQLFHAQGKVCLLLGNGLFEQGYACLQGMHVCLKTAKGLVGAKSCCSKTFSFVALCAHLAELALQIESVFRSLGSGLKVTCCYGGHPFQTERRSLEHAPAVWIGTPGRILDHLEKGSVAVDAVHTVILDEFDKSLELKFVPEMKKILARLPRVRRRVLTSATEAVEVPPFVGLTNPFRLSYLTAQKSLKGLRLYLVKSPERDKLVCLYSLLGELNGESTLVFCNHRESVERVSQYLTKMRVDNVCFHGGLEQTEREQRLALLRNGTATVFVTTDLAARGLDIPEVRHVVHYHLPLNEEAFVHRNGRTARMNAEGVAYVMLHDAETLPEYITPEPEQFYLPSEPRRPKRPEWVTLRINRGKRDKISKGDVVGFLIQKGGLAKEELGVVEVFDSSSLAAVKRNRKPEVLARIRLEKIKNKSAKYE